MEGPRPTLDEIFPTPEDLLQALPTGLAVLDEHHRVTALNDHFAALFERPAGEIQGRPISEILGRWRVSSSYKGEGSVDHLLQYAADYQPDDKTTALLLNDSVHPKKNYRLTIRRHQGTGGRNLVITLHEATEAQKREYKIRLLQELAGHFRANKELPRLLFTILTCATAGRALSFSRAFIFLPDDKGVVLECRMAVGPSSQEDAWRIWDSIAREDPDLKTMITRFDELQVREQMQGAFPELLALKLTIEPPEGLVGRAFREKLPMWTRDAYQDPRETPEFMARYQAPEFVAVPMVSGGRSLGVITADNRFQDHPIAPEDIEFLAILAGQSALALENAFDQITLQKQVKDLARANRRLSETRAKLINSEKMAAVGSVAARITHEIRNPLTTIGGFARRILRRAEPGSKEERNARIIGEEVVRMEQLLQGILDYSRPTSRNPERVDLRQVVRNVLDTLSGRPERGKIEIAMKQESPGTHLEIDPGHIRQVMINLLHNACEACQREGRVEVRIGRRGGLRTIEVVDDGEGIEPEALDRLFEPFYTTKISGTGLGLAITKALVETNDGRIEVASRRNEGTTFRLFFPLERGEGGRQESEEGA
jgi:hypothetical protein